MHLSRLTALRRPLWTSRPRDPMFRRHHAAIRARCRHRPPHRRLLCSSASSLVHADQTNDGSIEKAPPPRQQQLEYGARRVVEAGIDDLAAAWAAEQEESLSALRIDALPADDVARGTEVLAPLLTEQRRRRFEAVLDQRCGRTQVVFENPANPSNVWARPRQ